MSPFDSFVKPLIGAASTPRRGGAAVATRMRYRLDVQGRPCPFPVVEAAVALSQLETGEQLAVSFDCSDALVSLPAWAAEQGHRIVESSVGAGSWTIVVERG